MTLAEELGLPAALLERRQLTPAAEIFQAILREALDPIPVNITIPADPVIPFVLVRRLSGLGNWDGDSRGLIDVARMAIHVYTDGINGEAAAEALSEIIRDELHRAWMNHWKDPELGTLVKIKMKEEPTRASDWATSSGPVQYADLPSGAWRYETRYEARIKPPRK